MTWLLLRTSGFLVLGLLSVAVALGIAGPGIRNPKARLVSVTVHRAAAVTGTLLLFAHVTAAVLDAWVTVSPLAVVLPGFSEWKPLWIGLGAIAFDAIILLAVTSAMRRRFVKTWWNVHVISYVAYAVAWVHAVGAGTDGTSPMMFWLAVASAVAVGLAALIRFSRPSAPSGVGLPQPTRTKELVSR